MRAAWYLSEEWWSVMRETWQVVVYLKNSEKVKYDVGNERDAHEYARNIQQDGAFFKDERGVGIYFPVHEVFKIKTVPPDVELKVTKVNA